MRFLLGARSALFITVLLIVMLFVLFFYPGFRAGGQEEGGTRLSALLADEPLAMRNLPLSLDSALGDAVRRDLRDWWGFQYPPARDVYLQDEDLKDKTSIYNNGVDLYKDDLNGAITLWSGIYNHYPAMVTGKASRVPKETPTVENDMVLFALTRYNRGTAHMEMAAGYRPGDPKINLLLKMAIFDLRRAVGTFERLGRTDGNRAAYWKGLNAWQGTTLRGEHAGFPIHHAYANLSIAYLRLYDQEPDYPKSDYDYLNLQASTYDDDQNTLSPIVSIVTQDALANWDSLKREQYRLILALQNLEASGRGMRGEAEARFNYTIGLLLSHYNRRDDRHVSTGDAIDFLNQAVRAGKDDRAVEAARKELGLIFLATGDHEAFMKTLLDADPLQLEDAISGPRKSFGLLFTDMARAGDLASGDLERFFKHLALRREAFRQNRLDAGSEPHHVAVSRALAEVFFRELGKRLDREPIPLAGAVVHWLNKQEDLDRYPEWRESFDSILSETANSRLAVNLALRENTRGFAWIGRARFVGIVLLVGFWVMLYLSHRRVAISLLRSQYTQDTGR